MNALEWDFSKLPEAEQTRLLELYDTGKWWDIVKLHNKYKLSSSVYCCSNALKGVKAWVEYGIETGQVKRAQAAPPAPEVRNDDAEISATLRD